MAISGAEGAPSPTTTAPVPANRPSRGKPSAEHGPAGPAAVRLDAIIFDMDGVVTDTAQLHARCWKEIFDGYLRDRAEHTGEAFEPFTEADYLAYVDGKPRYEGAASFLWSRGCDLPWGAPEDPPGQASVCAIANLKDRRFEELVRRQGVEPFPSTVTFIDQAKEAAIGVGLISSSRHARTILDGAGLLGRFDAVVDGIEAEARGLPGKPDPAIFLAAADKLGVEAGHAAVIEDARAGVEAGRRGGFAVVVGIDRRGDGTDLRRCGADLVVGDLAELSLARLLSPESA